MMNIFEERYIFKQYHGDREQVTFWWDDDDVHIVLDKNM